MKRQSQIAAKSINASLWAGITLFMLFPCIPPKAMADTPATKPTLDALLTMSLEELVNVEIITATGSPKPISTAPAVASVITAADIEAMGATTLDEALETVPGLHVSYDGGAYGTSLWSIRGIHSRLNPHVLLLINNIPLTMTYIGSKPEGFHMPVAMISRIEVIRGPGSAIHGAEAVSGVINVITKDSKDINGTAAGGRYGSFASRDLWLQHGATHGGWDVALGIENQTIRGDDSRIVERDRMYDLGRAALSNAPGTLDTHYETVDTFLNLEKGPWKLHFYGSWQDDSAGPGAIQTLTYGNDIDSVNLVSDLSYSTSISKDWDLGLRLSAVYFALDVLGDLYPARFRTQLGNPITYEKNGGLETTLFYKGLASHLFRLAAGTNHYDTDTDQYRNFDIRTGVIGELARVTDPSKLYLVDQNRHLWYVSLQDEWSFADNWELVAGIRHDRYSDFGGTTNPRLALVWQARPDLTTKLLYGEAFRAPSFADQYIQNNVVALSNKDLEPEKIRTGELALEYHPGSTIRTSVNFFVYELKGLIEFAGPTQVPTVKQAINARDQESYGLELEAQWQVANCLVLSSSFARQRSRDENTRAIVPDAPGMQFHASAHWQFMPDWSLDARYIWVGDRKRALGDPRPEIKDYDLVNLTLRRKNIAGHFDAALAIRNLFDTDIREPSPYDPVAKNGAFMPFDYPMQGRSLWAEVRYRF